MKEKNRSFTLKNEKKQKVGIEWGNKRIKNLLPEN
jgi:hypothetical protein